MASVLDKGLAALVAQVRERLATPDKPLDGPDGLGVSYKQRRWAEVLRALHVGQKDVAAYVALAQQTGLSAKDCHAVAKMLIAKRKREEAPSWVERGVEIMARGLATAHETFNEHQPLSPPVSPWKRERAVAIPSWQSHDDVPPPPSGCR